VVHARRYPATVERTMAKVERTMATVERTMATVERTMAKLERAMATVERTMAKLERTMAKLGRMEEKRACRSMPHPADCLAQDTPAETTHIAIPGVRKQLLCRTSEPTASTLQEAVGLLPCVQATSASD